MSSDGLICIVEITKGSRNKYEYGPRLGAIKFDRYLMPSVVYPADYGFIPETLALDGDVLDVLVCLSEPTFPGCLVPVRPLGLFEMEDEHGVDDTVLCVPLNDPGWNSRNQVDDLPRPPAPGDLPFLRRYNKDLDPDRQSEVEGWGERDKAVATMKAARARYRDQADRPA